MPALGLFNLQALLHLRQTALHLLAPVVTGTMGCFRQWQLLPLCLRFSLAGANALIGVRTCFTRLIQPALRGQQLRLIIVPLRTQRGDVVFDAAAIVAHVGNLLLQTRHFSVGLIQRALTGVHCITGLVVFAAQLFKPLFGVTQARGFGFKFNAAAFDIPRVPRACGERFFFARKPQQTLRGRELALPLVILARNFGLRLQMIQLLGEFLPDVIDAQQIFSSVTQPRFGLTTALAVLGYARGFFEKYPQVLRLGFNHARNHALLNDGVGARAQAGTQKNIRNIAPAHWDVVDVIHRIAVAFEYTLDGYLAIRRPLPGRLAEAVVE